MCGRLRLLRLGNAVVTEKNCTLFTKSTEIYDDEIQRGYKQLVPPYFFDARIVYMSMIWKVFGSFRTAFYSLREAFGRDVSFLLEVYGGFCVAAFAILGGDLANG